MRDGDPAFSHHFHEIVIREPRRDVPSHAQDDELLLEATALKERIGIARRSRYWWDTSGVADQTAFSSARSPGCTNRRRHISII
jgi:hypothetical protein